MRWNLLAYYLIWYLVATFGNTQYLILIYLILALYAFYHFKYLTNNKTNELSFIILITFVGLLFDSANNLIFSFQWKSNYITWLLPIWLMFSMTLNYSLSFIFKNKLILIIFSFFGGPWAYFAASKVMSFRYEFNYIKFCAHGFLWIILMTLFSYIRTKICKKNSMQSF